MTEPIPPMPPMPPAITTPEAIAIIAFNNSLLVGAETRITAAIEKSGKAHGEQHEREHGEFIALRNKVVPHLEAAHDAEEQHDARVKPIVRAATWLGSHWERATLVAVAILGAIGWALGFAGLDHIRGIGP